MNYPQRTLDELASVTTSTIDDATYATARQIIADVKSGGAAAVREIAISLGDLEPAQSLTIGQRELNAALESIDTGTRELLERTAERIRAFAIAQRSCLSDCRVEIPGGTAGHRWLPLDVAGCYAPGGRYPLPSSILMTAVTARVAGVREVWVATPRPDKVMLAAAALAGADGVLGVGGAQAIAAMSIGINGVVPRCDVLVGPGNRYVTAAKALVTDTTRIDMLAGPSELVVVASRHANPEWVAADLLAQAEHDVDARAILITDNVGLATEVMRQLSTQLENLSSADVARAALAHSGYLVVSSLEGAIAACARIAPEHLSLQGEVFESHAARFTAGAALFIGSRTAQVLGDYGAGPNHVLPTGAAARSQSPLSVATFLRFQTQLEITQPSAATHTFNDAFSLSRLEGLQAHARSAATRAQS